MKKKEMEFEPHLWMRSGHAQTIGAAFFPRTFALPAGEERLFRVDGETQLKGVCHWQPEEGSQTRPGRFEDRPLRKRRRRDLPVIVIVHGLEGSSDSNYSRGIADKAWARGFTRCG